MGSKPKYTTVGPYVTYTTGTPSGPTTIGVLQGTPVPDDVPDAQIKHLLSVGLIAEDEVAAEALTTEEGEQVGDTLRVDDDKIDDKPGDKPADDKPGEFGDDGPPAKSASKADWVDYAVTRGLSQADAEASTRDDLVARFGGGA